MDMLFQFQGQEVIELNETSTETALTGKTKDGAKIQGADKVNIVRKGKEK